MRPTAQTEVQLLPKSPYSITCTNTYVWVSCWGSPAGKSNTQRVSCRGLKLQR